MQKGNGTILLIILAALGLIHWQRGKNPGTAAPPAGGSAPAGSPAIPHQGGNDEGPGTTAPPPGIKPGKTLVIITPITVPRGSIEGSGLFVVKDNLLELAKGSTIAPEHIISTDGVYVYAFAGRFVIRIPITAVAYMN